MSETSYSTERKFSGTTRLFIGFVIGALFALAPMYYYYMGREAALREGNPAQDQLFTPAVEPLRTAAERSGGEKPFASRMTYELSRLPEEPLAVVAKAPAAVAAAASSPASRAASPPEPPPAQRIVDARPISALPPDPRDRTAAIEREAQKPEYREVGRREAPASPISPRVIEGREVELKTPRLPDTPTRPIIAGSTIDMRAEIAAERLRSAAEIPRSKAAGEATMKKDPETRALVTAGPPVAGVTPITRATEKSPREVLLARAKAAEMSAAAASADGVSAPAGTSAQGEGVEDRLALTREWLASAAETTHTIQLMGTSSEQQLDSQLKSLAKLLEDGRIYVFRTVAQGKPSTTVVYGAYADRKSALQALEKLPPAVAANRPVLRTVNGIRAEMKKHKTDG